MDQDLLPYGKDWVDILLGVSLPIAVAILGVFNYRLQKQIAKDNEELQKHIAKDNIKHESAKESQNLRFQKQLGDSNISLQKNIARENLNFQKKIAENNLEMAIRKRKDELFDKRYKLYAEIEKIKNYVATRKSHPASKPPLNFNDGMDLVGEARYLFDSQIADELQKMCSETYSQELVELIEGTPANDKAAIERNIKFTALFNKYLSFEEE